MTTILCVEDETALSAVLALRLRSAGIFVDVADDGSRALEMCAAKSYDVVLLDCDLGRGITGVEVGAELRRRGYRAALLMLTASGDIGAKLAAFEMGADDYLTKPFEVAELIARIRVLQNRGVSTAHASDGGPSRPIRLLRDSLKLRIYDREVDLTSTEFKLLRVLEDADGSLITAEELCKALWGQSRLHHRKSLYVHINKIRSKLGDNQGFLETVKGVGYRIAHQAKPDGTPS